MISFTVLGRPQSKARPRHAIMHAGGGRVFSRTYTPKKTEEAEAMFAARAVQFSPPEPLEGPLSLTVRFYFPIPASWPKWKREQASLTSAYHTSKPDADNLVKLVKDSCNGVFWRDDQQVAIVHVWKLYGDTPRTEVQIEPLAEMCREVAGAQLALCEVR